MKLVWQEMERNIKMACVEYDDEIKVILDITKYEASGTIEHIVDFLYQITNAIVNNEMAKRGMPDGYCYRETDALSPCVVYHILKQGN